MFNKNLTIEDFVEVLVGYQEHNCEHKFIIQRSDFNLLTSLGRQTLREIPYTDRQYALVKDKLLAYVDQFESNGFTDIQSNFKNLRMPLREIDRSRWIRFETTSNGDMIAVRFTFQKKLISALQKLANSDHYDKLKKTHYFTYNEINLHSIISALADKGFEVQPELQEKYEILEMMNKNKKDYIPGIYSLSLKNLNEKAINYMVSTIGDEPNISNLAKYRDRESLFGIKHFDQADLDNSINMYTTLSQKIIRRTNSKVLIDPTEYPFDRVAESLLELSRYPILVVLNDQNDFDNLTKVYQSFRNIFNGDDFCTLYRKDNNTPDNIAFNNYIKENNLNNSLALSSKVVYTSINKMSKVLLQSEWKPQCALFMGSIRSNTIDPYINELDLVIHYDVESSQFVRFRHGGIERL